MTRAVEIEISGEVQGVSFRGYAAREAVRLELVGWVRNQPDGSVLAHVEGDDDAVEEMVAWCREGPPSAEVRHLEVSDVEETHDSTFEVQY
ncbi:MAG: acylphosphatase [Marmoricola sp.]|jgi:acylphosphatase|nr:acylphosphatase [Marmoricola sp.]MCW2820950.1 acylphosphatase [Marmoricola sp.]MCW2828099.1 acylphosphatase [Marmoricola sp.]MCW2836688.1 acylphosphatase [Marmoricola sp.]